MITRIRSPLFDPFPKVGDDVLGQLFLRRHLQRPMLKSIDQQALVHSSGNHRRTGFATGTNRRTAVDPQPALDLGCRGRVARVALADQDRPNPALKEFLSLRISCRQVSRGGEQQAESPSQHNGPSRGSVIPSRIHCRDVLVDSSTAVRETEWQAMRNPPPGVNSHNKWYQVLLRSGSRMREA